MQGKWLALLILSCALAACAPGNKCSGALVFDDMNDICLACPKDATFKDDTCVCKTGYAYVNFKCMLMDGSVPDVEDAGMQPDSGTSSGGGASCQDYCSFMNVCIGMNALAGALSDVVMALHADDPAACKSSCQSTLGSGESSNAVLSCIETSKDEAMCKDPNPQNGLKSAFATIGTCCGTRPSDPLCKSICAPLKANPLFSSQIDFCP